jgi:hypothetical protein
MRRETYTKALADVVHHILIGMASASALAAAETAEEKFAGITAVTPASRSTGTPLTSGTPCCDTNNLFNGNRDALPHGFVDRFPDPHKHLVPYSQVDPLQACSSALYGSDQSSEAENSRHQPYTGSLSR